MHPSRVVPLFHCIGMDVVKLPPSGGYDSLCVARCDFSGWVEAMPMKNPTSKKVAKFLWEIICRHGVFFEVKVDGGSEFQGQVILELQKLGVHRRQISAYNSKGNGMIERGHQPLINALLALTEGGKYEWHKMLQWVLLADRTTVHAPTGYTPFFMVHGREAVLPIETKYPTWRTLSWDEVHDRTTLIELRARQLQMRDEDLEEAMLRKERLRKEGQERFDANHQIRKDPIKAGDIVLSYDTKLIDIDMSKKTKLAYRWLGPFRVREARQNTGSYVLEELDGTLIKRTYAGNRIKKFITRPKAEEKFWFSPDDSEDEAETYEVEYSPEDAFAEEEAAKEWHENGGTQEKEKETGVWVRVPQLSEEEKAKYVKFVDNDTDSDDDNSDSVGSDGERKVRRSRRHRKPKDGGEAGSSY